MNDEQKAAQQLAAIQDQLVSLFSDFCHRSPPEGVGALLQEFREHRLSLVFTVTASMNGTDLFCGIVPAGGNPAELQSLFSLYSLSADAAPSGIH